MKRDLIEAFEMEFLILVDIGFQYFSFKCVFTVKTEFKN